MTEEIEQQEKRSAEFVDELAPFQGGAAAGTGRGGRGGRGGGAGAAGANDGGFDFNDDAAASAFGFRRHDPRRKVW